MSTEKSSHSGNGTSQIIPPDDCPSSPKREKEIHLNAPPVAQVTPPKAPLLDRFGGRFLYISILAHVILGLIAAWYVVQRIYPKPEPPLKSLPRGGGGPIKPKQPPKLHESQNLAPSPQSPFKRITVGNGPAAGLPMPPIQSSPSGDIPPQMGTGAGPKLDFGPSTINTSNTDRVKPWFGDTDPKSAALVGTFYDLKQTPKGETTGMTPQKYAQELTQFIRHEWNESYLAGYFKAPNPLYSNQIFIPDIAADKGPAAFKLQDKVQPSMWIVLYKGTVSPPESGVYHFVGHGDDILMVRFNGKLVLAANWDNPSYGTVETKWTPTGTYRIAWPTDNTPYPFRKGDALDLRAGSSYPIEILIGEQPGGRGHAVLMIEKENVQYQNDPRGNPILPIFRMGEVNLPALGKGESLPPYEPHGPIWKNVRIFGGESLDIFKKAKE